MYVRHYPTNRMSEEKLQGGLSVSEPLLIPKEYRGEMLRGRADPDLPIGTSSANGYGDTPPREYLTEQSSVSYHGQMTSSEKTDTAHEESVEASSTIEQNRRGGSVGEILSSLFKDNGSEDEMFLLLGVGLLLLFAHYDRHGNEYNGDRWDLDDLARLRVAYLLLG